MCEAYDIIQKNSYLAYAWYGGYCEGKAISNPEDAMEEAYYHVINNYDENKGGLENYTVSILKTIMKNQYKHEITDDEQTKDKIDSETLKSYLNAPSDVRYEVLMEKKSEELGDCISDLAKLYSGDLKYFVTSQVKDKKNSYEWLFDKYSVDTIREARLRLIDEYMETVEKFLNDNKGLSIRNFDEGRYLKSIDSGISYIGKIRDTHMVLKKEGSHPKNYYLFSIKEAIKSIHDVFYSNDIGSMSMKGYRTYVSLSGRLFSEVEDINNLLEYELIGTVLSRTSFRVVNYFRGDCLLLSSSKSSLSSCLDIPVFGSGYTLSLDFSRVVVKEVY